MDEPVHGAFRLRHTFSPENTYVQPQGSTDNLMDYAQGTVLRKYQWSEMRAWHFGINWFEDGEEAESMCLGIFDNCKDVQKILTEIKTAASKNLSIAINRQTNAELRVFKALSLELEKETYEGIIIQYTPDTKKINFKPADYKTMDENYLDADGKTHHRKGFSFTVEGKQVFSIEIVANEYVYNQKAESLRKYLFGNAVGKPGDPNQEKINAALDYMEQYLGNTYEQQCCENRTGMSEEALEKMDCSEFACRYLQQVCGITNVPAKTTADFVTFIDKENDLMDFIDGSEKEDFKDIQPGDIFLWRRADGTGHTGVVVSFNSATDQVTVMEAISSSGSCEEGLSKTIEDYCKGCVRTSIYTRTGKSLINHKGWKGYFRPRVN